MRMAKRSSTKDVTEEASCKVKRTKTEPRSDSDNGEQYFDPIHYKGKTEYDLDEILQEVDNAKYTFTMRSLCPGMAKAILKYKTILFKHLGGKFNFASIQTIGRAEASVGWDNYDPSVLPLCVQIVIQGNSRTNKEFLTQALKDLGFFGKNRRSPLFCSNGCNGVCCFGCFRVVDRPRNCLFDKGAHCHYLQTANCQYSYCADY